MQSGTILTESLLTTPKAIIINYYYYYYYYYYLSPLSQSLLVSFRSSAIIIIIIIIIIFTVSPMLDCGHALVGGKKVVQLNCENSGGDGQFCLMKKSSWPSTKVEV